MKAHIKVTHRQIAIMLTKALPIEGQEFSDKVEANIKAIQKLKPEARTALKAAYIFSRKVPREEREDFFQELTLSLLKANAKDEKLAYSIARCDWLDFWKRFKVRQHFYAGSLDAVVHDQEGNETTVKELLIGECEFEFKMDGKIEAERIYNKLPEDIKPIILKRLASQPLLKAEHNKLNYFVKTRATSLLIA